MPILKCSNNLYKIGKGKCMYKSKESAEKAYKAYLSKKYGMKEDLNLINKYKKIIKESYDIDSKDIEYFKSLGSKIGIDWNNVEFTPEDFSEGYEIELEHGKIDSSTNVTNDDPEITGKIAWIHLKENPKYYKLLKKYVEK